MYLNPTISIFKIIIDVYTHVTLRVIAEFFFTLLNYNPITTDEMTRRSCIIQIYFGIFVNDKVLLTYSRPVLLA